MIIHRKDSCWGITLFSWGQKKLELWLIPQDYQCIEHTHKDSYGEFFVLYGKGREIYRKTKIKCEMVTNSSGLRYLEMPGQRLEKYNISTRKYFKWLTVRANTPHGFSRGQSPMVFLCFQTYRKGCRVTSPAIDFHPVVTN